MPEIIAQTPQTGMPLPEHSWTWRRIFAFGMVLIAVGCQMAVVWGIWNLVSTVIYYSTQSVAGFDMQRAIAAQQVVNLIVPQAMITIHWLVVLQAISILLLQLYYMVAPSAETLKSMTVEIARITGQGPGTGPATTVAQISSDAPQNGFGVPGVAVPPAAPAPASGPPSSVAGSSGKEVKGE